MSPLEERATLDAFRRGERTALESVYRGHVGEIERLVRYGCTTARGRVPGMPLEAARDVVQEVFVKAFSESARLAYDGLRPYGPYLKQLARNLLIDRARRSGREVLPSDDESDEAPDPQGPSPEQQAHWSRCREVTLQFLHTLTDEERTFVQLRFVEELSQDQTAEHMKWTRRRVRTLERQVQMQLQQQLEQRGLQLTAALLVMICTAWSTAARSGPD